MNSTNIVFTGRQQAELRTETVPELPADGVAVRTRVSLISSGTETICYHGESDPGTHWHQWVSYPFHPGYSNVGVVEQTGAAVSGFAPGERVHQLPPPPGRHRQGRSGEDSGRGLRRLGGVVEARHHRPDRGAPGPARDGGPRW